MTQKLKLVVWQKAYIQFPHDSNQVRRDEYGNYIVFSEYGKYSDYGWNIDHIYPKSRGGSDFISNLRPLHWRANLMKGDRLPF